MLPIYNGTNCTSEFEPYPKVSFFFMISSFQLLLMFFVCNNQRVVPGIIIIVICSTIIITFTFALVTAVFNMYSMWIGTRQYVPRKIHCNSVYLLVLDHKTIYLQLPLMCKVSSHILTEKIIKKNYTLDQNTLYRYCDIPHEKTAFDLYKRYILCRILS